MSVRLDNQLPSTNDVLDQLRAEARRLGTDHALAMASWILMSERDALSVLDDIDPAVLDQWAYPNLTGEFADDPTPSSLLRELGIDPNDVCDTFADEVCSAWQEGADEVFSDALQGVALRTVRRTEEALAIERDLERRARQ